MNALSAYVLTQIVYENPDGTLTVIGDKMKAIEGEMERYMTRTDNLMKETTDLRESWSIASGKLSTVAQLTAETDADGNIIYYTSGSSGEQVVYYNPEMVNFIMIRDLCKNARHLKYMFIFLLSLTVILNKQHHL